MPPQPCRAVTGMARDAVGLALGAQRAQCGLRVAPKLVATVMAPFVKPAGTNSGSSIVSVTLVQILDMQVRHYAV